MAANAHLERLIHDLADPTAYPHPVARVEIRQTHGSCVFLTGEFAYKVKKPVDFGFMDFSTLERREWACRRELVLNRRLCPHVYLEVVPIVEANGRLQVNGPATPVEYAVRMRQLPEADMLPHRLRRGTVTAADVDRIAQRLAAFHAAAASGPQVTRYGTPEAVANLLEQNLARLDGKTGPLLPPAHQTAIRAYIQGFLARHRDLFAARAAAGRIREGHGDLRSQNLCLAPGIEDGFQIFDCIEFNEPFRHLDVASDIGYLAMDLDLSGAAALRRRLVDAYVAASGDTSFQDVLPFYLCYRAYVRGLIALLATEQAEIPEPEHAEHRRMALAAFDLARAYTLPRPRPDLVIMVGFSGSGKSVLARELARRLPAVYLASDVVRKELENVTTETRLSPNAYQPARRAEIYTELRRRAASWLADGENVLLDATFLSAAERENAGALAAEAGAAFRIIECRCPDALIRQRLTARQAQNQDPSDAGLAVYQQQLQSFQPLSGPLPLPGTPSYWSPVSTAGALADAAREVLEQFWSAFP